MRSWALIHGTVGGCQPFEHILHTVRTGQPGFDAAYGMPMFEYLAGHPEDAAVFDAAMLERTAAFAPSVAAGYDFSGIRTVVDVGGGRGNLLAAILRGHRHLQGTLFEVPAVTAGARVCWTRRPSPTVATSSRAISSKPFRLAQTATCSRTCCMTGTTPRRPRSWPAAATP